MMPNKDLNPTQAQSVLITGCSSGIGLVTAQGLQKRGYRVFATARKANDVEHLQSLGLESLQLDLDDSDSIKNAVQEVLLKTDGKLYGLFNNGAYGQPGAVEDLSRAALRYQFETNVFGWLELTNLIIPVMREQGYGRIIQNSSILGFIALKYRGAYIASKHALEGLTDTLRLELADTNIKVSLVQPGPIESRFRDNAFKYYQRFIIPEESAHSARYAAMEERLKKEGTAQPFTLPADAVMEKVAHALASKKPKARYYVTFPTYLFAYLKRILPGALLDKALQKVA